MRRLSVLTMFLAVLVFDLPGGSLFAQHRSGNRGHEAGGRHVIVSGSRGHVRGGKRVNRGREFVGGGYYPLGFDNGSETQIIIPVGAPASNAPVKEVIKEAPPPPQPPPNAKVVDVPVERHERAAKPAPPAVFVLKNGERFEARQYTVTANHVRYLTENRERHSIPVTSLNIEATESANRERGLHLLIPLSGNEISLGF